MTVLGERRICHSHPTYEQNSFLTMPNLDLLPALRANIAETVLVLLINEQ